ncbi:Rid family hydrolase [Tersicoccus phoenicis]|uniref:Rid family hydrolase n=1 Tax=Tersicoccus phoenicis TaxID=554083 RepID=UPI001F1585D2|nr:Rid family hydrolase [Tersicoccus phoenicis]
MVEGAIITEIGTVTARAGDTVLDCTGRLVMPGFIDVHAHVDGLIGDDAVQRALLRQGVTTVVVGQDGVSCAPGDGGYATEYFAAINGSYPDYSGAGVGAYLAGLNAASRLNAAYLVPAGTVRFEVCGRSQEAADASQRSAMVALVEQGMRAGAVGLSSGLDYVPGLFQDAGELAALCGPVARAGGVYVSHMRGGYEKNAAAGIAEITEIAHDAAATAGVALRVHISHFHADADIVLSQLDGLAASGVDATFDAYPYTRGCSLISMPLLPPELLMLPVNEVVGALGDAGVRKRLRRDWFPRVALNPSLGPGWPHMITFAHLDAPEFAWAHGLTIAEAATRASTTPIELALDAMKACRLRANIIMAVPHDRSVSELGRIFAHPGHMGGSDGIFIGAHPHPRARGTFARLLREYVRETRTWTWTDAVHHLSSGPAARFGLGDRGVLAPGAVADIVVVDPGAVTDVATYDEPMQDSIGIDDVLVAGVRVLAGGVLTAALPGQGLRHRGADHHPPKRRDPPMTKTAVQTANAPQPAGPYSQGVIANGFFYTAGFGPQHPASGAVADSVADQTRQTLRNVGAVLAEHGLTLDDCVKTTVHLADLADFAEFNEAYQEFFSAPYPVRTTVGSQLADILVEIA